MERASYLHTGKLKRMNFSFFFLEKFMKDGINKPIRVTNPIPEDASIIRIGESDRFGVSLIIYSNTFEALKPGDEIPIIEQPIFEVISESSEQKSDSTS